MKTRDWKQSLEEDYERRGRRKPVFYSDSKIELEDVYDQEDLTERGFAPERDLGLPGQYPYTRGIYPGMYRADFWIMGQYSGFGNPEATNQRFKYLLSKGQTALALALDLPTQLGIESDAELAEGEVGKAGVAVNSLRDLEKVFEGIPLSRPRQIFTTANAIGPVMLALFLALGEKQGLDPSQYTIVLQNDILKEYVARGAYIFQPEPSVRFAIDAVEYCTRHHPHFKPIVVCGSHMRQGGASAIQEVAFTLSNAQTYIEEALSRGLKVDDFAPSMECQLSVPMNLFEEVAKYRAFRRMWARMMKEKYGAENPETMKCFIRVYTTGYTMTAQQPLNNIVRVTIEALAAILGGAQSLSCNAMDEVVCIPSEEAARVALMTQHILANETGIADVADPLGGSYYTESLTCDIEKKALELMDRIREMGGAHKAIEEGFYQRLIRESASEYQQQIEKGERIIVGLNRFQEEGEKIKIDCFRVEEGVQERVVERLHRLKEERDNDRVEGCLGQLKQAVKGGQNTVPALLQCAKAYATIGEMCRTIGEEWGFYQEGALWM
ncbi:MAG: methylmalonyl-CoA mutase [Deltaproteobacteria bacterium]|nr:methylmalonyl-CoA mutase [Deltaproteobacteria bacterium]MBW2137225.1 methylmalonyl-CoA mutase [Deltaproteobacteria bacterium]